MRRIPFLLASLSVLFVFLVSGCLTNRQDNSDEPAAWASNVGEWYFLSSISADGIQRDEPQCSSSEFPLIRYRLRGDSLDLGWPYFDWVYDDTLDGGAGGYVSTDTFWFGGTYVRHAGKSGSALGTWGLVRHGLWEAGSVPASQEDSLRAEWDFLYHDEEMSVTSRWMSFAYPDMRLRTIRWAEYLQQGVGATTFQYVGRDSLLVTRDSETVSMKLKPFQSFRAHSSLSSRSRISVSLADSCRFAGSVVDSTWLHDFIYDEEGSYDTTFVEKAAARGPARRLTGGR